MLVVVVVVLDMEFHLIHHKVRLMNSVQLVLQLFQRLVESEVEKFRWLVHLLVHLYRMRLVHLLVRLYPKWLGRLQVRLFRVRLLVL